MPPTALVLVVPALMAGCWGGAVLSRLDMAIRMALSDIWIYL